LLEHLSQYAEQASK